MENVTYGISPEEEMSNIMKDIEKNIKEQEQEENNQQQNIENEELASIARDEDNELASMDSEANTGDTKEDTNEADLFREKYYLEKKRRKTALADRQKLEQENQELKQHLNGTIANNTELYGQNLYNDLERIRNIKRQALLGEDPDLFLEADELHKKTMMKINEFENLAQNRVSKDVDGNTAKDTNNYIEKEEQIQLAKAQEWLNEHPELIEETSEYNPKIQKELSEFIKEYDRKLRQKGRQDEILGDNYFDVLDEFLDSIKVKRPKEGYSTSKVGGVRNNFSASPGGTLKVTLTDFDKNYARNLGISEKEYLKWKIQDIKETRKMG